MLYIYVTDANGQQASAPSVIIPSVVQFSTTTTNAHCAVNDGTISLTVNSGTSPFTFLWNNGATTQNLAGLAAGWYTVTVTDINGCYKQTDTAAYVHNSSTVSVSANNTTLETCHNDGGATATASGGTGPYTYVWNTAPVQTGQVATGLSGDTYYSVTATDANGCANSGQVYVSRNLGMSVSATNTPEHCQAHDGTLDASFGSGGTAPFTFLWSNNATTSKITGLSAGIYTLTVTDVNGCIGVFPYGYVESESPITLTVTGTPEHCHDDGSVTASAANGNVPYTYLWSNGDTTAIASNVKADYYSVTVTDKVGCSAMGTYYLAFNSVINVSGTTTPEHCINKDGTVSIVISGTGVAPYSYSWSNGDITQNIAGLAAGQYSLYIKDANGCRNDFSIYVDNQSPIVLNTTYTQSACHDGTATANASNGIAPYSYYWNTTPVQTTKTAIGLEPNYYQVKVTDSQGCYKTATRYVEPSSILTVEGSVVNEHCYDANGSVTITRVSGGTPPYTYKWYGSSNTGTSISGCSYGYYTVVVTDAAGCDKTKSFFVYSISPVSASLSYTAPSCSNADGTATATVSGGTPPYTYSWTDGQATQTATNLREGYYGVTVRDVNNCDDYEYIFVAEPDNCNIGITRYRV